LVLLFLEFIELFSVSVSHELQSLCILPFSHTHSNDEVFLFLFLKKANLTAETCLTNFSLFLTGGPGASSVRHIVV
jgi:hypothetical protein